MQPKGDPIHFENYAIFMRFDCTESLHSLKKVQHMNYITMEKINTGQISQKRGRNAKDPRTDWRMWSRILTRRQSLTFWGAVPTMSLYNMWTLPDICKNVNNEIYCQSWPTTKRPATKNLAYQKSAGEKSCLPKIRRRKVNYEKSAYETSTTNRPVTI